MTRRLPFDRWLVLAALLAPLAAGCVEKRYVVLTDPPGAIVYENGKPIGATPLNRTFVYYGRYRLELKRDGYQTLVVDQPIRAPWYEWCPLDFVTENLLPWTVRDVRELRFSLEPLQVAPPEAVFERGEQLRQHGHTIGTPPALLQVNPILPAVDYPQ
jgi:hypothetical protein